MKKVCVCFAGVPGCDKSPLAVRLSWEFGLPVFSNDMIRREIRIENQCKLDIDQYNNRKDGYLNKLLAKGRSIVYDASVDRTWQEFKKRLTQEGYDTFLISFDLSAEFVTRLGSSANSLIESESMQVYFTQHDVFLDNLRTDADVHITDESFADRFDICIKAIDDMLA